MIARILAVFVGLGLLIGGVFCFRAGWNATPGDGSFRWTLFWGVVMALAGVCAVIGAFIPADQLQGGIPAPVPIHQSTVGPVIDVAHHQMCAGGCFLFLGGAALMALAILLVIVGFERGAPEWSFWLVFALFFLLGWGVLSSGSYWLRSGFGRSYYFRAGRGGISVRIPGSYTLLGLSYHVIQFDLPWADIRVCQPHRFLVNGLEMESYLDLETARGGSFRVYGWHFREELSEIVENLDRAREATL